MLFKKKHELDENLEIRVKKSSISKKFEVNRKVKETKCNGVRRRYFMVEVKN